MGILSNLSERARLAINRMTAVTEKEKKLLQTAMDAEAAAAIVAADSAVADHVAEADPHTQYMQDLIDDKSPTLGEILDANDLNMNNLHLLEFNEDTYNFLSVAGKGYLFVEGTTPTTLVFQDDTGTKTTLSGAGAGLTDIVDDTTPQLGGDLDINGNDIVSTSNGNISLLPNGTGNVVLGNFTLDADQTVGAGQDNYVLTYDNGTGTIQLEASTGGITNIVDDTTPQLGGDLDVNGNSIVSVTAGDINITPDTTGNIVLDGLNWPQADGTSGQVLQTNGAGQLSFASVAAGSSPSTGYGGISAESNATTTTFGGSSTDWTNKVQVLIFDTNGVSSSGVTPDHTNDHITVSNAGPYFLHASITFSGGSNDTISFAFFKNNGATQIATRTTRKLGTGGDVGACDISALADLSASDTVELWVQNEATTGAITIQDINFEVIGLTGLGAIVEDTTPQLGGDLDVNGSGIVSASNGDIAITPNGTGDLILDGLKWPQADGTADYVLKTDGAGQLSWTAGGGGGTDFLGLTDTPASYTGKALDWLRVNAAATALEFTDPPVQSVSATSPVQKSGTTSVTISMPAAAGPSTNGYMTGADKAKLDTVSSNATETSTANVAAAGAVMDTDFSVGIMVNTASGTYASRTLTAGNGITVTNGNGVSGNPTAALDYTASTLAPSGTPADGELWFRHD